MLLLIFTSMALRSNDEPVLVFFVPLSDDFEQDWISKKVVAAVNAR